MRDGVEDARQASQYTTRCTALLQYTASCAARRTVPSGTRPAVWRAHPLYVVPHNPHTNKKQQETTPRDNLLLLLTA